MKIIGHRGASGLAPENTLASVQMALDVGVDEIEIDVHVTKDAIPVLSHDATLLRLTGSPTVIANNTYADLQLTKPDLVSLEAAITYIDRRTPLVIEVKPGVPTAAIIALLQTYLGKGWAMSDFLLSSRQFKTLKALHRQLPGIQKVVIDRWSGVRGTSRARRLQTRRLTMNHRFLWFGFVKSVSRHYDLCAYTLNEPPKAQRLARHGLYGVITDYPDRFKT